MSARALNKVLELFLQRGRHEEMALLDSAEAELEAIEKAAKDAIYLDASEATVGWWDSSDYAAWERVTNLFSAIAKESGRD